MIIKKEIHFKYKGAYLKYYQKLRTNPKLISCFGGFSSMDRCYTINYEIDTDIPDMTKKQYERWCCTRIQPNSYLPYDANYAKTLK